MQHHPRQLAVRDQHVGAAAQKAVRNMLVREQPHHFRNRLVAAQQNLVRRAADSERCLLRERNALAQFDAELFQSRRRFVANPHVAIVETLESSSSASSSVTRPTLPAPIVSTASPGRASRSMYSMPPCSVLE